MRTVFCFILLFCLPFTVGAQEPQYKIEGVNVDVTAENAVMAREKAFEEAQVKAFKILAERILNSVDYENFAIPDIAVISSYVQDFEVTNEQLSSVRYKGTYTFRFRSDAITGHMDQVQTSYSLPINNDGLLPVLMLPYIQVGSATNIWDEGNPFMKAWERAIVTRKTPVNAVVPIGDVLDIQQLYDDPALNYTGDQMRRLVARYEAREAIIAIAEKALSGGLDVSLYKTDREVPFFLTTLNIPANPGYPDMRQYDEAVNLVAAFLQQTQKQQRIVEPGQVNNLKGRTAFSGIKEWLRLKRILENVDGVKMVRVQGLKPREAIIEIEYIGSEERFIDVLKQSGVSVNAPQGYSNNYNAQLSGQTIYDIRLNGHGAEQEQRQENILERF